MPTKLNIADQQYVSGIENPSKLIQIPNESESHLVQTQSEINSTTFPLSERNYRNSYIIPIEKDSVYLNFVAEKIIVKDYELRSVIDAAFSYFVELEQPEPDPFLLEDGIIFRCAGEGIKSIRDYTYYIMENGKKKLIPNFKTLEVLLAERGSSYSYIRVLESNQCNELEFGTSLLNRETEWTPELEDMTNMEKFNQLTANAQEAQALMESAAAAAAQQVQAVQAAADADKAAAQAAQAQAQAAQAASQAAIAQAAAAQAAAEAAKAEAELAKAEFESK